MGRKLFAIVLAMLLLTGCVSLRQKPDQLTQYNATFLTLFDTEHKGTGMSLYRRLGTIGDFRIGNFYTVFQSVCIITQTAAQYQSHGGTQGDFL